MRVTIDLDETAIAALAAAFGPHLRVHPDTETPVDAKAEAKPDVDGPKPQRAAESGGLVTAGELAALLGLSRRWVYDHAADLGAIRVGDGTRPRLRFDVAEAKRRLTQRDEPIPAPVAIHRRRQRGGERMSDILAARKRAA